MNPRLLATLAALSLVLVGGWILALRAATPIGTAAVGMVDGDGLPVAAMSAAPNPIDVLEVLTITVACPTPPEDGAHVRVLVRGRQLGPLLAPTAVDGSGFTVDYEVPIAAGFDMTLYASCAAVLANEFTSNRVDVDVIPLTIPTPFAIPASITAPTAVRQGEVLHVEVVCSGAPPTEGRRATTRPAAGWEPGIFVDLRPFITVAGNGYMIDYPIPSDALMGEWTLTVSCDDPVDFVVPGAPPWDDTRTFNVTPTAQPPPVTLPPTR